MKENVNYKDFLLSNIASLENGNKLDKNKMTYSNPSINFVSRTASNNGISSFVDKIPGLEPYNEGCIALAFGGSVGSCFLQDKPFYTGQNVGVIILPEYVSKQSKLYFISALSKKCKNIFSAFNNEINKHFKTDLSVKLPCETIFIPDYEELGMTIGRTDMKNIDTSTWKEFKLEDLFEKINTPKIKGRASDFPSSKIDDYIIPLLTAGVENQGLSRYAKREQCQMILKNCISISANGANTGVTFYQSEEFAVLQDAYALKLKDGEIKNKEIGLFLASSISKLLHGNYDWSNKAGWNKIKNQTIKLPAKELTIPDWDYMESYIAELEQERVAELDAYLKATGLNDYELTDDERKALKEIEKKEFGEFEVGELFEKIKTPKIQGKASDFLLLKDTHYTIPLLTCQNSNNGLSRYAKREQCSMILKNVISVAGNGTAIAFYQSEEFAVLQDAYALKLKNQEIPNKEIGLYLTSVMSKLLYGNYDWSNKAGWNKIKTEKIKLPLTQTGKPDFDYMEKYITAIQKLLIKNITF